MKNLVIFDFSGTLSIGAVLFAREENLLRELKASGLWQIGLNSLDMFWNEVITPTWLQGATTTIGYKSVLTERLKQMCHTSEERISRCVSLFADHYLNNSSIHPTWSPVLHYLLEQPATVVLIATDHYAEATDHILNQLQRLDLPGVSAPQVKNECDGREVIVANSADLGYLKSTARFWQVIKTSLHLKTLSQVIVVDDFGFNESSQDSYAASEKITARQYNIADVLSEVFGGRVQTFFFLLQNKHSAQLETVMIEFQEHVRETEMFIKEEIL